MSTNVSILDRITSTAIPIDAIPLLGKHQHYDTQPLLRDDDDEDDDDDEEAFHDCDDKLDEYEVIELDEEFPDPPMPTFPDPPLPALQDPMAILMAMPMPPSSSASSTPTSSPPSSPGLGGRYPDALSVSPKSKPLLRLLKMMRRRSSSSFSNNTNNGNTYFSSTSAYNPTTNSYEMYNMHAPHQRSQSFSVRSDRELERNRGGYGYRDMDAMSMMSSSTTRTLSMRRRPLRRLLLALLATIKIMAVVVHKVAMGDHPEEVTVLC